MEDERKKVLTISGPSGVGKSVLCNILLHHSDRFAFSVSATTRKMRLGEKHGVDYYFLSEEEFKSKIEAGEFIEWEELYPGQLSGTLRSEVTRLVEQENKIALFDVDVLGAMNIKKHFNDAAHTVLVKPESTEALEKRLRLRGTESEEEIQNRIKRFEKELSHEDSFDAVLINTTGDIATTKENIIAIADGHFL